MMSDNQSDGQRRASKRGFASMTPERQREIASQGGRKAHANGNAHQFSSEEAREAGRKGGRAVSRDREHMAAIGRKGGEASSRGGIEDASGGQRAQDDRDRRSDET